MIKQDRAEDFGLEATAGLGCIERCNYGHAGCVWFVNGYALDLGARRRGVPSPQLLVAGGGLGGWVVGCIRWGAGRGVTWLRMGIVPAGSSAKAAHIHPPWGGARVGLGDWMRPRSAPAYQWMRALPGARPCNPDGGGRAGSGAGP